MMMMMTCALGSGCDRFPRDNPVDPDGNGPLTIVLSDRPLAIADTPAASAFNNDNARVEPGETVLVTVPLDVRWTKVPLATIATVTNDSESTCTVTTLELGQQGNQFMLTLPPTKNESVPLPVGPTRVNVGSDCVPGTALAFTLNIGPLQGKTFAVPFEVEVAERGDAITLANISLDDSNPLGGNGDGKLDPGETVVLMPELRNTGDNQVIGLTLQVLATGRACVQEVRGNGALNQALMFGNAAIGRSVTSPDVLQITVDPACASGDQIELPFQANDANGQQWNLPFIRTLGDAPDASMPGLGAVMPVDSDAGL